MSITLGIHLGHDGGAAICADGEILVACQEERLSRVKYANGWWHAVRYCLEARNLRLADCDAIIFSNAGVRLAAGFDGGLSRWADNLPPTHVLDHHQSHAIGAYCFSPFSECLVFVGDSGGNEGMTESIFVMEEGRWERVGGSDPGRSRAKGLGTTYEAFTNFLGFRDQESGKTMALAAYGDPMAFQGMALFDLQSDGRLSSRLDRTHHWGVRAFSKRNDRCLGDAFPDSRSSAAADIAAYVQREFTFTLEAALTAAVGECGTSNIALSGGIALNCTTNQVLGRRFGRDRFYAFPVCSDAGLALGNALFGQWKIDGYLPKVHDQSLRYGRNYSEQEVQRALARHPDTVPPGDLRLGELTWRRSNNPARDAAACISSGAIVAWWQGRSETGPRALGARSLLASATRAALREQLNSKVKRREWFRPLAPSIADAFSEVILLENDKYPYMNMAPAVSERGRALIPAGVHIDGTARVQTVTEMGAPELHALLQELARKDEVPCVINTSFNIQEPIVETPGDAIATFLRSNIDVLFLGDYVCERHVP